MASAIGVQTIQHTNGTDAMTIDSVGRVKQPTLPRFSAHGGSAQSTTGPAVVAFTTADVNVGSCYSTSTYRFVAPVAGDYYLFYSLMSGGANYLRTRLRKNGSTYIGPEMFNENETYSRTSHALIATLAANDYVEVIYDTQGNSQGQVHGDYRSFCGYLVG